MKLLNRFYQVSSSTLTHSFDASAYLLDTDEGLYLIDCGTPEGYAKCLANIGSLGYDPRQLKAIIGTHGHYDHLGAAALFKRDFGTPLWMHALDRVQVESGDAIKTTAALLYGSVFTPCLVDRLLTDAERLNFGNMELQVLHTPGHTLGSVSIALKTSRMVVLIAADTLYGGFSLRIGSDEELWKKSLDRLCGMNFDLMSFGHCSPGLVTDVATRLDCAKRSFAIYYNPWFKDFTQQYTY
jgi:glyoxylase-like metal-dependent hydrolase (beta-lactamase superfamily II)